VLNPPLGSIGVFLRTIEHDLRIACAPSRCCSARRRSASRSALTWYLYVRPRGCRALLMLSVTGTAMALAASADGLKLLLTGYSALFGIGGFAAHRRSGRNALYAACRDRVPQSSIGAANALAFATGAVACMRRTVTAQLRRRAVAAMAAMSAPVVVAVQGHGRHRSVVLRFRPAQRRSTRSVPRVPVVVHGRPLRTM